MKDKKVYVDILEGPMKGARFLFRDQDTFMVGRSGDCTLAIKEDSTLSRHHMLLEINDSGVMIRDLGSLNGTKVNGRLIYSSRDRNKEDAPAPEVLQDGDRIEAGLTVMELHIDHPAFCVDCGRSIFGPDKKIYEFIDGSYLCHDCRQKQGDLDLSRDYGSTDRLTQLASEAELYDPSEENPAKVLEQLLRDYLKGQGQTEDHPQIQGYTDLEVLGEGGYGVVYKATRVQDHKVVAVKTLLQTRKPGKRKLMMFDREKEIAAQLIHPNIVRSESAGVWNGIHFIEMEYIEGGSLWELMGQGRKTISFDSAIPIILGVLEGLAYAHDVEVYVTTDEGKIKQTGIVHRDIKPSNILLAQQAEGLVPKISDFGLAKAFGAAGCTPGLLSRTGTTCGSPLYMAPEHLTNFKYVTASADVFELGATIFYMLAGQPIRPVRQEQDPFKSVLEDYPRRIRDYLDNCPEGFSDVMDCALAYNEKERFANGREFLKAFKEII